MAELSFDRPGTDAPDGNAPKAKKPVRKLNECVRLQSLKRNIQALPTAEGYPLIVTVVAPVEVEFSLVKKYLLALRHADRAKAVRIDVVERKADGSESVTRVSAAELENLIA